MSIISRIVMTGAALALAGCSYLPGANLGGTFTAENYLGTSIGGTGFDASLAREYQALVDLADQLELQVRAAGADQSEASVRTEVPTQLVRGYEDAVAEYYRRLSRAEP